MRILSAPDSKLILLDLDGNVIKKVEFSFASNLCCKKGG